MKKLLLSTPNDFGLFLLRLILAGVIFPHGAQKALGMFGGHGFDGTMEIFTKFLHIPPGLAMLAIAAEFAGPIALVLGFFTRLAALGIGTVMAVAAVTVHQPFGFFMNWFGNQDGEGFEYHILAGGIALVLFLRGGGAASIDRALAGDENATNYRNPEEPA